MKKQKKPVRRLPRQVAPVVRPTTTSSSEGGDGALAVDASGAVQPSDLPAFLVFPW